jgi:hypothetical protein
MNKATKIINEAEYLLDFQKEQLILDLGMESNTGILDTLDWVWFKLFGKSLDSLSPSENHRLRLALREHGYEIK